MIRGRGNSRSDRDGEERRIRSASAMLSNKKWKSERKIDSEWRDRERTRNPASYIYIRSSVKNETALR